MYDTEFPKVVPPSFPATSSSPETEPVTGNKLGVQISLRAHEIVKAQGISFKKAFIIAMKEIRG